MTNQMLCLVIGRVRLVFGCPEVIPHMEEAQRVVTGSFTKTQLSFTQFGNENVVGPDYQAEA